MNFSIFIHASLYWVSHAKECLRMRNNREGDCTDNKYRNISSYKFLKKLVSLLNRIVFLLHQLQNEISCLQTSQIPTLAVPGTNPSQFTKQYSTEYLPEGGWLIGCLCCSSFCVFCCNECEFRKRQSFLMKSFEPFGSLSYWRWTCKGMEENGQETGPKCPLRNHFKVSVWKKGK